MAEQEQGFVDLCTGIGGLTLGALMSGGFRPLVFCDNNKRCQEVVRLRFPHTPIIKDIKDVTAQSLYGIGIERDRIAGITAGFPCQPHSVSGKKKGSKDPRNLWPDITRILRDLRPRWAVFENVPGLFTSDSGRFIRGIFLDLATLGFDAWWGIVPCAYMEGGDGVIGVGGVHLRERVWIIAIAQSSAPQLGEFRTSGLQWQPADALESALVRQENGSAFTEGGVSSLDIAPHPNGERERQSAQSTDSCRIRGEARLGTDVGNIGSYRPRVFIADSHGKRRRGRLCPQRRYGNPLQQQGDGSESQQSGGGGELRAESVCRAAADAHSQGLEGGECRPSGEATIRSLERSHPILRATAGDPTSQGLEGEEWAGIYRQRGQPESSLSVSCPQKVPESPICGGDDGLPPSLDGYLLTHAGLSDWLLGATIPKFTRLSRDEVRSLSREDQIEYRCLYAEYQRIRRLHRAELEALGNAVVPQVAALVFDALKSRLKPLKREDAQVRD